jgi:predicted double-glycine peptidase
MRRRKIKRITQRHENSCGQTCVAMLANVSYDDVIELWVEATLTRVKLEKVSEDLA